MKVATIFWKGFLFGLLGMGLLIYGLAEKLNLFLRQDYRALELYDLQGKLMDVSALPNQPLVVNYWATWCGPCIAEFPYFDAVRKQFDGKITFVMISDDPQKKVRRLLAGKKYGFVFLTTKQPLSLNARPVTFFYNKDKQEVCKRIGALDSTELYKALRLIQ